MNGYTPKKFEPLQKKQKLFTWDWMFSWWWLWRLLSSVTLHLADL
jgi:hypothetical protein